MLKYLAPSVGLILYMVEIAFAEKAIQYMQNCFSVEETKWLGFIAMFGYIMYFGLCTFLIAIGDNEKKNN